MAEKKWTEVSKGLAVAFSFPCVGNTFYVRKLRLFTGCTKPNEKHGHIELLTLEEGYVFIPFSCYSQAGVKAAVELFNLEEEGFKGILDLPAVKMLPEELTEQEKIVLASPSEMDKLAKLRGFWRV